MNVKDLFIATGFNPEDATILAETEVLANTFEDRDIDFNDLPPTERF